MKALVILLLLLAPLVAPAATMVEVTYRLDGKPVGRAFYSGRGGWEAAKYWTLLGSEPMFVKQAGIKPDREGGLTATLKGKIDVSIVIRGGTLIGTADAREITFIRKEKDSDNWFLTKAEAKRIAALAVVPKKGPKKNE